MPCVVAGCGNAVKPETRAWNSGSLCNAHYAGIAGTYNSVGDAALKEDFIKVHALLHHNVAGCIAAMERLEQELQSARVHATQVDPRFAKGLVEGGDGGNYVKLSRALEYYEGYCWFPANRVLLLGILSEQAFFASLKLGFSKDPGAGTLHGEQTHRVQWHAIMHYVTEGFTTPFAIYHGWAHSPLELYYAYTQGAAVAATAWAAAMDRPQNAGWGNPDNVMRSALASNLPMFKDAFTRRARKIGGPKSLDLADEAREVKDGSLDLAIMKVSDLLGIPYGRGYNQYINNWRKTGTAPTKAPGAPNSIQYNAWQIFCHLRKNMQGFEVKKAYRDPGGNMLAGANAPGKLKEIDLALVGRSRLGFNPDYVYSAVTGSLPANPAFA